MSDGEDSDFDLDYGSKNSYVPASGGDGGQGQFGAISPNNWRVAGTSPVGEVSYEGAATGGDEPWFAEACATVFLDLGKAEDTMMAFTREAAEFKMEEFEKGKPYEFTTKEAAFDELVGALGYSSFLDQGLKNLMKTWDKLHPKPKEEKKKPAAKDGAEKEKPTAKAGATKDKPKPKAKPKAKKE